MNMYKRLFIGSLTIIVFGAGALTKAAETLIPIPPQAELLKSLRKGHPRLCATAEDFKQLKSNVQTDSTLSAWYKDLKARANGILNEPQSKYEIPDGLRLLGVSRKVMNRIYTLGLCYKIDGEQKWVKRAYEELEAAANFKDWNPRHFLDTAEMTHAFAIGYDWFYEALSDEQRQVLRNAMIEKGIKPAIEVHQKASWWSRARHNWNQVCNGGVGMGALAIADVEPDLASQYLSYALKSIQLAMAEYAPDGGWAEGPGYWNYATSYNTYFLSALNTALGTDFGLSKIPGFDKAGDFPIYMTGPLNRTFNYADSGDGAPFSPCLFWLAKQFNQPAYAIYESRIKKAHPLDIVWYQPLPQKSLSSLPLDKYFRNIEVVSFRSKWDDEKAIFIGFKGGDNKANHSHLDLGSFVLDALGKRWAVDIGGDNYNLPGYFGKQRWTYYRLRTEGHNAIVLNPDEKPDQDTSANAKIIKFDSKPERSFAITDLTRAYSRNASNARRGIMLLDRRQVIIQDEVETIKPSKFYWFMHTPAKIEVNPNGKVATLMQGNDRLIARIVEPAIATFTVMRAEPLPESPHPEKQANNSKINKLAVKLEDVSKLRLVIDLTAAVGDGRELPKPKVVPLQNW